MFNQQELSDLVNLLSRVEIKGNEAIPLAKLQIKIQGLLAPQIPKPAEAVTGPKTKEEKPADKAKKAK